MAAFYNLAFVAQMHLKDGEERGPLRAIDLPLPASVAVTSLAVLAFGLAPFPLDRGG
jgi:hypothetical protein